MPVKDLVTFTPLKQHRLKAAKSRHRGIRSLVLLKPLFCSREKFLLFCAPSDHRTAQVGRDLGRSSGPPCHGKGSPGGIVEHLVQSHPTAFQQWGLSSVPGVEMASHDSGLEIMEVVATLGSEIQNVTKTTPNCVSFIVQPAASYLLGCHWSHFPFVK